MTVSSRVMAIGHQTQTMHSTATMAGAMSTASKVGQIKSTAVKCNFFNITLDLEIIFPCFN